MDFFAGKIRTDLLTYRSLALSGRGANEANYLLSVT
jgi:hypothetical protein